MGTYTGIAFLLLQFLSLYFHFRWALLNTHDASAWPSAIAILARVIAVIFMALCAIVLQQSHQDTAAAVLWTFVVGFSFGPVLDPPFHIKDQYEDLYEKLNRFIGNVIYALFKGMVVSLVALPLGLFDVFRIGRIEIWSTLLIGMILSYFKIGFVRLAIQWAPSEKAKLGYTDDMDLNSMRKICFFGVIGFLVWSNFLIAVDERIPELDKSEIYNWLIFSGGVWVSSLFKGE